MSLTISIMTAISAGIYASQGGGTTSARHTWAAGPMNLLRAAQLLPEHQRSMDRSFGNLGHAGSWVQIGDQRIDPMDLPDTLAQSRDLLHRVESGAYAAQLQQLARDIAEWNDQEDAKRQQESAAEMAELARQHAEAEAREQAEGEAVYARACAEWAAAKAAEETASAAARAEIDQRQAARMISRSMQRDWRRAGC